MSDLISIELVLKTLCDLCKKPEEVKELCPHKFMGCIYGALYELPTVEAESVRHGHWLKLKDINGFFVRCSVCLEAYGEDETNYCPNCGSKMDEEIE